MTLATSSDVTGMPSCRDGPGLDSIDLQRSLYHANSSTWMFWWGWTLGLGQISKFPLRQVGHFRSKGVFFFVVWSCYSSKNAAMFFLCHMMFGYKKLQPTGFWREDHLGKSRSISSWPQVRRFEPLQSCRLVFFFADGEDLVSVVGVGVVQCIRGNPNHILDQNVKPQPTRVFLCSIGNCHAQPTEAVPSFFYRSRNFGWSIQKRWPFLRMAG